MQAILARDLVKRYKGQTALNGLSLEIRQGELFSLLGENGAGKTTAVKVLTGLTPPTAGEAFVAGYNVVTQAHLVKSRIGVSCQESAVAPNLSARENLELICGIYGFSKEKTREKIDRLSHQLSLEEVLSRKAGKLSGGWQRRVSLAMALISEPAVLFLDEPTLGLDVLARHALWEQIRLLKGKVTILMTTHYLEEAQALSDRIGILKNGRLLAAGTTEQILAATASKDLEEAFVSMVKEGGACGR